MRRDVTTDAGEAGEVVVEVPVESWSLRIDETQTQLVDVGDSRTVEEEVHLSRRRDTVLKIGLLNAIFTYRVEEDDRTMVPRKLV